MFYEDPSNEGTHDLEPEELLAFEAGSDLKFGNYSANVTLFSDYGKKVIDWVWQADRNLYKAMNIAEIDTRGFEISSNYAKGNPDNTFEINNIGVSISAISLTKVTGDFISKYSLDFLKYKFNFHTDFNFTRSVTANLQVGYFSRNGTYLDYSGSTGNTSEIAYQPYWLADIRLSYINRAFRFNLEVTNLLNSMYTDVGNLIQAGRWITAGIQVTISGMQ
jgi:iron complex outermembrane receptor protein